MDTISRFQENMHLIRMVLGQSAEKFGAPLGLSRQSINNFEANRSKMTKAQYIALRSILDAEIKQNEEETKMLKLVLDVFVDHPEKYSEDQKKVLKDQINMLTPSILAGTSSREEVSKALTSIVLATGIITAAALSILGSKFIDGINEWLYRAIFESKK